MLQNQFIAHFDLFKSSISPSYLTSSPYRELLQAIARGEGKLHSVIKKAKLAQSVGEEIVQELQNLGILTLELSRQNPLKAHPKQKLKRELRAYRIEPKLRFTKPFYRFWFGFISPFESMIERENIGKFLDYFDAHQERVRSWVYEQLCDALLAVHLDGKVISSGSYWDHHSEFDILAITEDKKIVLGECKYKERKVCKNELSKLKNKAKHSGIPVHTFALFAKQGFSKELLRLKEPNLLLFDLQDLKVLLR